MTDFSIELNAERIVDYRTKRYFAEVQGCYSAGFYRSAVVMLWSVVVTDILFKLDHLANAYGDTIAKNILQKIGKLRTDNPKSPEWEAHLVNEVATNTELLDFAEHSFRTSLQNHRHLSAHPVLTGTDALFSPNKETVRAHIRNSLEAVLTKPPLTSRKVFDTFVEDVEQISRLSPGLDALSKFLATKYFPHFSNATFAQIFKSLWRVAFKSQDARALANREINTQALIVVLLAHQHELLELIKSDREWFSDVSLGDDHIKQLNKFFRRFPQIFTILTDAVKTPLTAYASLSLDHFAVCWYISDTPETHVGEILRRIDGGETLRTDILLGLQKSLKLTDAESSSLSIGIHLYWKSPNFNTADARFDEIIRPSIASYAEEHFVLFLKLCESNPRSQPSERRRALQDHREIESELRAKFRNIRVEDYPEFARTIAE